LKDKPNVLYIEKTNRSCFALENQEQLLDFLKKNGIDEIHLTGFDINDCVLATLYG
jgi:nicotinamidase-related amidase